MYSNIPATGLQNGDEASTKFILAGRALLVKLLITLEPRALYGSNIDYLCIVTLFSHWCMHNGDEAPLSINLAGPAILMKMLIHAFERCGKFRSNFVYSYSCFLAFSRHRYEKR